MASPGKYFKKLIKDKVLRERLFRKYILLKYRYTKGESEIGFIRHALGFQSIAIYYLTAEQLSSRLNFAIPVHYIVYAIPVLLVLKLMIYYLFGRAWDRNNLFHYEQDFQNERNIMLKQIKALTERENNDRSKDIHAKAT